MRTPLTDFLKKKNERKEKTEPLSISLSSHAIIPPFSSKFSQLSQAPMPFISSPLILSQTGSFHFFFLFFWLSLLFALLFQINYLLRTTGGLSGYLFECNYLPLLPDSGLEDGFMTPDSVLEPAGSNRTSSGSGGYGGLDCRALACTATTEIVRRKRSGGGGGSGYRVACRPAFSPVSEISVGLMNRRKGTPQRAPLYWFCVRKWPKDERGKGGVLKIFWHFYSLLPWTRSTKFIIWSWNVRII